MMDEVQEKGEILDIFYFLVLSLSHIIINENKISDEDKIIDEDR